jgi:hypothetical protein
MWLTIRSTNTFSEIAPLFTIAVIHFSVAAITAVLVSEYFPATRVNSDLTFVVGLKLVPSRLASYSIVKIASTNTSMFFSSSMC